MSATDTAPETTGGSPAADTAAGVPKPRFGMRAKMLLAFAVALTVLFGLFAWFIVDYVGRQAQNRLVTELQAYAEGGAKVLNSAELSTLMADLPEYDPNNPYPTNDPRYVSANQQLVGLQSVVGVGENFSPYTYTLGSDGKLQWLTSWSAVTPNPPFTNQWRGAVADTFPGGENSDAYRLLSQGLTETVNQPQYTDDNGTWISTYTPIRDSQGTVIAGLAADFNIAYVDEVRTEAIRSILPLLLVIYLLLLGLIFLISTWITRPVKRLTKATELVAGGDYDLDLAGTVKTRWPDELTVLAHSFGRMVEKVRAREKNLTTQVKKLKVEIDAKKREQAVNEITDSDFFAALSAKAANQRQRKTELEEIEDEASAPMKPVV